MRISKLIFSSILISLFSTSIFAWRYPELGNDSQVFRYHKDMTGHSADGFVSFKKGFSVDGGATRLGIIPLVQEEIRFRNGGLLILDHDLELDSNCTLSIDSLGFIHAQGNRITFNGNLSLPANRSLEFISDAIIDGKGKEFLLNDNSQLIVDSNVTLTLKNMTLKTTSTKSIRTYQNGSLALYNVKLALGNDFEFENSRLFIHEDVIISGLYDFIYSSTYPCLITRNSTLAIDTDTAFTYSTYGTDRDLIIMETETSVLLLNGCTLRSTFTGVRLTLGRLLLDNDVTLSSILPWSIPKLDQTQTGLPNFNDTRVSHNYSYSGTRVESVSFYPDGRFFAAGGNMTNSYAHIEIYYTHTSDELTLTYSTNYQGNLIYTVDFSPDGKFLAVGGNRDHPEVELYLVGSNGDIFMTCSVDYAGSVIREVVFSNNGKFLAIVGNSSSVDIELYYVNDDGTLSYKQDYNLTGISDSYAVDFAPNDNVVAIGGDGTAEIGIVLINSEGEFVSSKAYSYAGTSVRTLSFSPDGKFLAVGGGTTSAPSELDIFSTTTAGDLIFTSSASYAGQYIYGLDFSPDGKTLVVCGNNSSGEVVIYDFEEGGGLTLVDTINYGGSSVYDVEFCPDGHFFAFGGNNASNEIESHPLEIPMNLNQDYIYKWSATTPQPASLHDNAITFGNNKLGNNYNLETHVLSGSRVLVDGYVNIDNVA